MKGLNHTLILLLCSFVIPTVSIAQQVSRLIAIADTTGGGIGLVQSDSTWYTYSGNRAANADLTQIDYDTLFNSTFTGSLASFNDSNFTCYVKMWNNNRLITRTYAYRYKPF